MFRSFDWVAVALGFCLLTSGSGASAESGLQVVQLTLDNIAKLGFSIVVTNEGGATLATISGPEVGPNNCPASRIGAALLDSNDGELTVFVTHVRGSGVKPTATGYSTPGPDRLAMWIDYHCSGERLSDGRRYYIPSISAYMAAANRGR